MWRTAFLWPLFVVVSIGLGSANSFAGGTGAYKTKSTAKYGEHKSHKYKTYLPTNANTSTPVVIFIPGGSWIRNDRKRYSFVGKALAKQGFITAIPGYRVYPEVKFPGFVEDIARAVADIRKKFAPDRPVFLMGHSAGAHIAAMLTYDKSYLKEQGLDVCQDIAGFIGLAGPYDFNPSPRKRQGKIFPPKTRGKHMPITFATANTPPVLLIHGSWDRIVPLSHSKRFHSKLRVVGSAAQLKIYKRVGHLAILGVYSGMFPTSAKTVKDVANFLRAHAVTNGNTCK